MGANAGNVRRDRFFQVFLDGFAAISSLPDTDVEVMDRFRLERLAASCTEPSKNGINELEAAQAWR